MALGGRIPIGIFVRQELQTKEKLVYCLPLVGDKVPKEVNDYFQKVLQDYQEWYPHSEISLHNAIIEVEEK
jgi:hypothetical protein